MKVAIHKVRTHRTWTVHAESTCRGRLIRTGSDRYPRQLTVKFDAYIKTQNVRRKKIRRKYFGGKNFGGLSKFSKFRRKNFRRNFSFTNFQWACILLHKNSTSENFGGKIRRKKFRRRNFRFFQISAEKISARIKAEIFSRRNFWLLSTYFMDGLYGW